ncbi:MAG TPA: adenylate/guanylate cyclase domain-containing protein [Acidimicrobiales bacterium]|nr:adenylate/guanylate cyclase domain-containing protein [Acidimicrobiales bacterium]
MTLGPEVSDAAHRAALARVRAFLFEHRVPEEDIARAESEDVLDLLVVDCLLVPGVSRYTEGQVAEITGMPEEMARRFWRALGFADVTPDDTIFTDLDIDAIHILQTMVDTGAADVDTSLQLARVIGSSMARIAEAEVAPSVRGMTGAAISGVGSSVEAADRFVRLADTSLPAMARLLEFAWRRHVQAAVRRAMLLRSRHDPGALPDLCVGFADMVGFTMLSQQLSEEELAALVSRFEDVAHDTVTSRSGRVVKMIGDEVMFVTDTATDAARIALALAEAYADDELLSDVRVALAVGPVLVQDGDFYGPVVNLASRAAGIAAPGSVLVSDEFHATLLREIEGRPVEFAFKALRPRLVKDLGRVQLWALHRPGSEPLTLDRRASRRWERLSEVLHELDDLRERGERLLSGAGRAGLQAVTDDAPEKEGSPEKDGPEKDGPERMVAESDTGDDWRQVF